MGEEVDAEREADQGALVLPDAILVYRAMLAARLVLVELLAAVCVVAADGRAASPDV